MTSKAKNISEYREKKYYEKILIFRNIPNTDFQIDIFQCHSPLMTRLSARLAPHTYSHTQIYL